MKIFGSKDKCFKCDTKRPNDTPQFNQKKYKDWWCNKCNMNIFGSKDKCFKCNAKRPDDTPQFNNSYFGHNQFLDYDCPGCGRHNFKHNQKCFKCQTPRPHDTSKYDCIWRDYNCTNCEQHNFCRNNKCFKCQTPRPENIPKYQPKKNQNTKMFDHKDKTSYDCLNCGHHNFACNDNCRICKEPAPKISNYNKPTLHGKPGDWFCHECGDFQFAKNKICKKCDYIKEVPQELNIDDIPQDKFCLYCMSSLKDTALVHDNNTAHLCVCYSCAEQLKKDNAKCPVCPSAIISINKVY
jgi:hypothetical protein